MFESSLLFRHGIRFSFFGKPPLFIRRSSHIKLKCSSRQKVGMSNIHLIINLSVQLHRGQVSARVIGVFRHIRAVGHLGKLVQAVVFVAFHHRTVFGNAHDISKLVVGLRLSVAFSVSIQKMRIRQIFINYQLYYYPVGKFQSVFFVFFV